MKRLLIGSLAVAAILSAADPRDTVAAAGKLALDVSPSFCTAPGSVRVRVTIEPDSQNRTLEIVADSVEFYRRTMIELEGDRAARTYEMTLVSIPSGEYDVSATLLDAQGGRTVVHRTVTVM